MIQCDFCRVKFTNQDSYRIHLGVGAPSFHPCNDAEEMTAKGMSVNDAGEWSIPGDKVTHVNNWTYRIVDGHAQA